MWRRALTLTAALLMALVCIQALLWQFSTAAKYRLESERLQLTATDAYSRALPVVVE